MKRSFLSSLLRSSRRIFTAFIDDLWRTRSYSEAICELFLGNNVPGGCLKLFLLFRLTPQIFFCIKFIFLFLPSSLFFTTLFATFRACGRKIWMYIKTFSPRIKTRVKKCQAYIIKLKNKIKRLEGRGKTLFFYVSFVLFFVIWKTRNTIVMVI